MNYEKEMKGKVETCWKILMESVLADVNAHSEGKTYTLEELHDGFTYTKQMQPRVGKPGNVKVVLATIDPNKEYRAEFHSAQGVNILQYKLDSIDDNHFKFTYDEDFLSEKSSRNMNFGLMSALFSRSSKKRINTMLNQLQSLVENAEGSV